MKIGNVIDLKLETYNKDLLVDANILNIKICYIEQSSVNKNLISYRGKHVNPELEKTFIELTKEVSENPSKDNILKVQEAKKILESTAVYHDFYYKDATTVYEAADVSHVLQKTSLGNYVFQWDSNNQRPGNYFLMWSWEVEGSTYYANKVFLLEPADSELYVNSTLDTPADKYDMLLNLYLPPIYKYKIKSTDLTPDIIKKLNSCVAKTMTSIESRANHLIDLLDPKTVNENALPLLANMFNLRLRTDDTSLWRRQIGQAVPLYKRKGTITALKESLDQIGVNLVKLTRFWQVTSNYIWKDGFCVQTQLDKASKVQTGSIIGNLSKIPIGEIEVFIKSEEDFLPIPKECITIIDTMKKSEMPLVIWNAYDNVELYENDVVLLKYKIQEMPEDKLPIEDYIQNLPLADQREASEQKYPLKNWNVHLLEEDDPLFDVIIQNRHPFVDPVVYGKIRTDFVYSEKTYNMDTYDGSLRDSVNPCHLDKDFIDSCSYCQSSSFSIDVEISELSTEKMIEIEEVVREYSPFHAILHSINVSGTTKSFIPSSEDNVKIENMLFGNGGWDKKENMPKNADKDKPAFFGEVIVSKKVIKQEDQSVFTAILETSEANGAVLSEMALQLSNGDLYVMQTHPEFHKTNKIKVTWSWELYFV